MGELLDALNSIDHGRAKVAAQGPEPIWSVIEQATESVIVGADSAVPQPDTAFDVVTRMVRETPLAALTIAFLLGTTVARQLRR